MKLLHFVIFAAVVFVQSTLQAAGTVELRNLSYPHTLIEAGTYVQVVITGSTPKGTVTVVQNGGAPYVFGTTNDSGNWDVTALETTADVNDYYQTWYVNDVAVSPVPQLSGYLSQTAYFPSFSVYPNGSPSDPAVNVGDGVNSCGVGSTNVTPTWLWNPVTVHTYSSAASSAANSWGSSENRVTFSVVSTGGDISVAGGTLGTGVYAQTALYTQGCTACYGHPDTGSGVCANSTKMKNSEITLNSSLISTVAGVLGVSSDAVAASVLTHELGHTLGLGHEPTTLGICSQVGSVMATGLLQYLCGIQNPTGRDTSVFGGIYPSSPTGSGICYSTIACQ